MTTDCLASATASSRERARDGGDGMSIFRTCNEHATHMRHALEAPSFDRNLWPFYESRRTLSLRRTAALCPLLARRVAPFGQHRRDAARHRQAPCRARRASPAYPSSTVDRDLSHA